MEHMLPENFKYLCDNDIEDATNVMEDV